MLVTLTPEECAFAAREGAMRRVRGLLKRNHRHGEPRDPWAMDINGCAAEIAFAKGMGMYWWPRATPDPDGDVGDWQVRWTEREDGALILHESDRDDQRFALVIGSMPDYRIAGWMFAAAGKIDAYWRDEVKRPAFFVPQDKLNRITALKAAA